MFLPTNAPIASVAYSKDGSQIATGDVAGEVSLWDASTKQLLKRMSFVPVRDWSWPIVIAASFVWLVAWIYAYARGKRRRRARASEGPSHFNGTGVIGGRHGAQK